MTIPVSRHELISVGSRFTSEEIIAEIDRFKPLVDADLLALAAGGYPPSRFAELTAYRAQLVEETAARRAQRAEKKRARSVEQEALASGRFALRAGIAMAEGAIAYRAIPEGEPAETSERVARDLLAALEAARGAVDTSAKLRTRLSAIVAVLGSPSIAPRDEERPARAMMIGRLQAVQEDLTERVERKKGAQQQAILETEALDEIDGRAYLNMRTVSKIGRAHFRAIGDRARADAYRLTLDDRPRKPAQPPAT